jgi:hypothetical protein
MKNYLIKGLHKIGSTEWWPGSDRAWEGDLYPIYKQMNELSEQSFFHFLDGDWELINLVSEATDVNHVFRQQFQSIWEIWQQEPCNIFYCGSDTQMIKPTKVFDQYQHFLLFNYTDPKSFGPCTHFLNADIRYYPSTMSRDMWDWALAQTKTLDWWNGDQLLYNQMVWSQGLGSEKVINPRMAYQGFMLPGDDTVRDISNQWNGCRIDDAHLIHWHGSRGAQAKLELMQSINTQLGVPVVPVRSINRQIIDISHIK